MSSLDDAIAEVTHALTLAKVLSDVGLGEELQRRIINDPQIARLAASFIETAATQLNSTSATEISPETGAFEVLPRNIYRVIARELGQLERLIEVTVFTEDNLLAMLQFGPESLRRLKIILQSAGLTLRREGEDFWAKAETVILKKDDLSAVLLLNHPVSGARLGTEFGFGKTHSALSNVGTLGKLARSSQLELSKLELSESDTRQLAHALEILGVPSSSTIQQ